MPAATTPEEKVPEQPNQKSPTQGTAVPKKADKDQRTNVRFSPSEFTRLKNDSVAFGFSIAETLRRGYFRKKELRPMFALEHTQAVLNMLTKIGAALNSIATHLGAGYREGFNNDLIRAFEDVRAMKNYLGGYYGHR